METKEVKDIDENKTEIKDDYIDWKEEYWSIKRQKLWALKAKFEKVEETNPELGKELLACWEDLMLFNIPIARSENGIDFVLTTHTSLVVGHGKFIDKLKDVSMEEMDYELKKEMKRYMRIAFFKNTIQ